MSTQDPAGPGGPTRLVGVIGGVGPLATALFLETVARLTEADRDQDPGPVMAQDARRLQRWRAGFVVVPCNTAHHDVEQKSPG